MNQDTNQINACKRDTEHELVTSRRRALLGMVGLAGTSLVSCASVSSEPETAKSSAADACGSNTMGIDEFLEQFSQPLPESVAAAEGMATVGTANLWYRDTGGNGETIILVHPTNLSGHCWGYQEKALSEAGYRVISYSRRGYLGSDSGSANDSSDAVDDLLGLVEYLKLERFHLVSAAGGGAIAAGYASRLADDTRLASLVVACSLAMFEKSPDGKIIVDKKFKEFEGEPKYLLGLSSSYRDINPIGVQKWKDMNAEAMGKVKLTLSTIQSFGANTSLSDFRKIKVPTLYISGSADLFCTPVLMSNFSKNTPGSKFGIMNGAGHTAFWEAPKPFNTMVLDFIQNV